MREGWRETTLGEVASFVNGYPFKPDELSYEGMPVIRIKQLLDEAEVPDRSLTNVPERCILSDGDLVFSWSGTLAVRLWDRGPAYLNQHLFRVIEQPGVDRRWLACALECAIEDLLTKTHGTTMKHVTKATLLPHPILLPPLDEQRRIVDLIAAVDEAIEAAGRVVERALCAESALRDYAFKSWIESASVSLIEKVEVTTGRQRSPKHAHGDHMLRYVRAANVKDGTLVLDEPQFMNFTPSEQRRYALRRGDVLVTEGCGSKNQIGASCEWNEELPGTVCFQNHLLRLRTRDPISSPQRIVYHWALWSFRSRHFSEIATGTNIFSLGSKRVEKMLFPDLEVAQFAEVLAVLDSATTASECAIDNLTRTSALRSALLADLLSGDHEIPASYDALLSA